MVVPPFCADLANDKMTTTEFNLRLIILYTFSIIVAKPTQFYTHYV